MADLVERIIIEAATAEAQKEIKKLEKKLVGMMKSTQKETKETKKHTDDLQKSMGKMFDKTAIKAIAFNKAIEIGQRAMGLMVDQFKKGVGFALEYERTVGGLQAALKAAGKEVHENTRFLNEQAAALQYITGVSDEVIRDQYSFAVSQGVAVESVDKFTRAAHILARTAKMEVKESMRALANAQNGVFTEAFRLVPAFANLTDKQKENVDVIEMLNKEYGELLSADMMGAAGDVKRFANAWDDLAEAIGKMALASGATSVMSAMSELMTDMAEFLETTNIVEKLAAFSTFFAASAVGGPGAGLLAAKKLFGEGSAMREWLGTSAKGAQWTGMEPDAPFIMQGIDEPGKRRKKRKGGGGPGIDLDLSDASIAESMEAMEARNEQIRIAEINRGTQTMAAEEELQNRLNEVRDSNAQLAQFRADADAAYFEKKAQEKVASANKAAKDELKAMQTLSRGVGMASNLVLEGFKAIEDGSAIAAAKFLANMLSSIGGWLIGSGPADIAKGTAMNAMVPGSGVALMAAGTNEVAIGTGLKVAGTVANVGIGIAGAVGGGSGGGGGGAAMMEDSGVGKRFAGGAGGGGTSQGERDEPAVININVNAMTPAAVGVEVRRALDEAGRQGLL